jgi:hypothetical protein
MIKNRPVKKVVSQTPFGVLLTARSKKEVTKESKSEKRFDKENESSLANLNDAQNRQVIDLKKKIKKVPLMKPKVKLEFIRFA